MDRSGPFAARAARWLRLRWPRYRGLAIVGLLSLVFSIVLSEILIARYLAFQTAAWDLGNYNQAFYTTVSGHGFFYYTADLPSGNGGHLFAAHFAPILLLLLPVYAVAAAPPTLLVLEAVSVAFTTVPLYLFARTELASERWALFLAAVCLASPVLMGIVWYDFHPEAFLPLTIVAAVVGYRLRSWKWFLVAWFLALMVIETAAPVLLAFGILAVWGDYFGQGRSLRESLRRIPWPLWAALLGSVVWLGLTVTVTPIVFGTAQSSGAYSAAYSVNFRILGADSILAVIPTALFHPAHAWAALNYDSVRKATFVLVLLGSLGFLPLFGRLRYLLPGLIWPALAIFSNAGGYYAFSDQYAAYTFPFLALAAVDGLARLRDWSRAREAPAPSSDPSGVASAPRRRWGLPGAVRGRKGVPVLGVVSLLVGLGVSLALVSPLGSHPIDSLAVPHGIPSVTAHDDLLHDLIGMIPPQASVLTSHMLFPEVSSRPNAYVLPVSSYFAGNRTFFGVLDQYVNESDYLLYDTLTDPYSASIFQKYVNLTGFGVLGEEDGAVLYERGWSGPPALWVPESLNLTGGSLAVAPAYAAGPSGMYPDVLRYLGGSAAGTELWSGPFFQLVPGTYEVTVAYRVDGTYSGSALEVGVESRPVNISVVPVDVTPSGHDYSITVVTSPQSVPVATANVSVSSGMGPQMLNLTVVWPAPGFLDLTGTVGTPLVSVTLYAASVLQVSPT